MQCFAGGASLAGWAVHYLMIVKFLKVTVKYHGFIALSRLWSKGMKFGVNQKPPS
jgi:hypothetical protein